jgi:hypothetical protein
MANIFLKVSSKFMVSEVDDSSSVVDQFNSIGGKGLSVSVTPADGQSQVGFELTNASIVSGAMTAKAVGKNIEVDCQAIFKISPRPQFNELILDPQSKWNLDYLRFLKSDGSSGGAHPVSGLEITVEEFKNRFGVDCQRRTSVLPVVTSLKQKELAL